MLEGIVERCARAVREADGEGRGVLRLGWSAVYGASIGLWRGQEQILLAALKLPLVLALTWLATAPCAALLLWCLGRRRGWREITAGTLAPLACAALLLASLAPIAALFSLTLPPPGVASRTEHNVLFLLHTVLIASAGVVGVVRFRSFVGQEADGRTGRGAIGLWIVVYALVGGQIAWMLRPFVGSVYEPIELFRARALDGNLYEFIASDIWPYLWRQLFR